MRISNPQHAPPFPLQAHLVLESPSSPGSSCIGQDSLRLWMTVNDKIGDLRIWRLDSHPMRYRIGLACIGLSIFFGKLIRADSLNLTAQLLENGAVVESSNSVPVASVGGATAATGSLALGTIGAKAGFPRTDYIPAPNSVAESTWSSLASAELNYSFSVQNLPPGLPPSSLVGGEAAFTVNLNGVASLSNTIGTGPGSTLTSPCAILSCSTSASVTIMAGETFEGVPANTRSLYEAYLTTSRVGSQKQIINTTVTIFAPIVNGDVNFDLGLTALGECPSIPILQRVDGATCAAYANFFDPATITSAAVYDSKGNQIPGATLVSQTGFSPVSTPEPQTLLLYTAGGVVLLVMRRRIWFRISNCG